MTRYPPVPFAVCVPARDEGDRLLTLFAALRGQLEGGLLAVYLDGGPLDEPAHLLAFAREMGLRLEVEQGQATDPNAGRARRRALAMVEPFVSGETALLTTDADTIPSPFWVKSNLAALERADVVIGDIRRNSESILPMRDRLERYLRDLHLFRRILDPAPYEGAESHPFCGGASIALRRDHYGRLGGFAELAAGEDADLARRAVAMGLRVARTSRVHVQTSSRRVSRAHGGLGTALSERCWDVDACEPRVEDPLLVRHRYEAEGKLRIWYDAPCAKSADRLASLLGVESSDLLAIRDTEPSADAFLQRLDLRTRMPAPAIPLGMAERRLAALRSLPRRQAA